MAPGEGLRQRKKRVMRQLISDTAPAMFLERGFEEVRVAEVAAACDVSEKTVYNYFPTKESLLFDQADEGIKQIAKAPQHLFGAPQSGLTLPLLGRSHSGGHGEGLRAATPCHDDLDRWVVADHT